MLHNECLQNSQEWINHKIKTDNITDLGCAAKKNNLLVLVLEFTNSSSSSNSSCGFQ